MDNLQKSKFLKLISRLARENPYYKDFFQKHCKQGLDADELYGLLPYQNRNSLQNLGPRIYTPTVEEITIEMTSGTTGVPLECPKSNSERINLALDLWTKRRAIDPQVRKENFFLLYGSKARKIHNFFNYSPENLITCLEYLGEVNPRWICGSISALNRYAQEIDCGSMSNPLDNLRYIELQGEYVDSDTRHFVEDVFHAKTVVHYGNREMWTMAYECQYGHLHPNDSMAIFEIKKAQPQDTYGHIIVTSLNQVTLPIIKYDTGDLGYISECNCQCGEKRILNILDGRVSTIIKGTTLNGNILMKGILNSVIKKDQQIIRRFYVEQMAINTYVVYITKGPKFKNEIEIAIQQEFKARLGDQVHLSFNYTTNTQSYVENKNPIFRVCC